VSCGTRPLPAEAEIFVRKGQQFARWKDARGKARSARVTIGPGGSQRIVVQAASFTAKFRDGQGVLREVATGCRSKDGALSVLRELTGRAEKVRSRILTPAEDQVADHVATAMSRHITDYFDHQTAKRINAARVKNTRSRLLRLAAACQFKRLPDVNESTVERWLADRQAEGMSAGARNGYREAWIGFGNWCVRTGRLLTNPLADLPVADARADCRRKRRALTESELDKLLDAARRRPLLDATLIRRGPNKGKTLANISPAYS
jgi:integrase